MEIASASHCAVTLRIWLPTLQAISGNFNQAYQATSWLAWVPNLLFCEYYVVIFAIYNCIHTLPKKYLAIGYYCIIRFLCNKNT